MTPISPRSTPADAGVTPEDASTPLSTPATDAGMAPETGAPFASTTEVDAEAAADPAQWILYGRGSLAAADHGGRNGTIFAYDPISQLGDWISFDLAAGVLRDLTDGNVRFRLGGTLGYTRFNGGENTSGSHLNLFTLNPRAELDWRRAWGTGPVAGPSRLGIEFGLGVGFGSTTVDGGFQIHDQLGFAMRPRADLNLLNVRLGGLEMGIDFFAGTSAILGNAHNSAFVELGGALTFRTPLDAPAPVVRSEEACSLDRRGEIVQRIHQLQSESAQLRAENEESALFLDSIRTQLEVQGVGQEELVTNLRSALVDHLARLNGGESPTPSAELVGQLQRLYATYLRTRAIDPVSDPEARGSQAREVFPDDFDLSTEENRQLAAQTVFPDDFDPYSYASVETVEVPEPLPTECDDLEALRTRLEDERADLREQKGLIDGLTRMGLTRLGVPAASAPRLVRAITRLSEIHFITARPYGAPDRVPVRSADIAPINAAADAWGRDHRGEVRPLPEIEAAFASIFPRTRRAPTDTTPGRGEEYSPSLAVIQEIAETLRSPDMRGAHFYVVGHTDSRGSDEMNQRLSLRRAQAIRDALVFFGVDPEMITPVGRGETRLVYYYDQPAGRGRDDHRLAQAEVRMLREDGIRGTALSDEIRGRQATNRRIEMFICMPNVEDPVCSQLDAEIRASAAPGTAGSTESAGSPVQTVETPAVERPRRRRSAGTRRTEPTPTPPPASGAADMDFSGALGTEP